MPGSDLKKLYCGLVRSVIEYSSVTYGPMLTKYQANVLENIQKRCLKCMYGYNKGYQELLEEAGLKTLQERRQIALERFTRKAQANPLYSQWFEENENPRRGSQRFSKRYKEKMARTSRLYNSPVFTMRRILNGTPDEPPMEGPVAYEAALNDPFALP